MRKKMLLFKRSLKTVLFLAVLSICSPNTWAQSEVETGLVRIRDFVPTNPFSWRYLGEEATGTIRFNDMLNENVFLLDTISKGRYIMALKYEETKEYTKGRFVFRNYLPEEFPDLEESVFRNDPALDGLLLTVDAIRIGNALYLGGGELTDVSKLEELVQAGSIIKINLNEINNFTFLLNKPVKESPDDNYPFNSVIITSEIGGTIMVSMIYGKIGTGFDESNSTKTFLFEQVDDPTFFNEYAGLFERRGLCYFNQEKPNEAIADLSKGIELKEKLWEDEWSLEEDILAHFAPSLVSSYCNRAVVYESLGKKDLAMDDCKKAANVLEPYQEDLGDDYQELRAQIDEIRDPS